MIEKWTKGCIFPFPKKDNLGITMNYRSLNITAIIQKVSTLFDLKSRKFLEKIRTVDREINPHPHWFWLSIESFTSIQKNLEELLLFVDFFKAFDSIHKRFMEQIFLAYGYSQRNCSRCYDALQKHENNSSLTIRWHKLLRNCHSNLARW